MSQLSPRFELPYLLPSQAQKHVTHNEALQRLDVVTQLTLRGFVETTPPALPAAGDIYGVGVGASGSWSGQDATLAYWDGAAWLFITPQEGWRAWSVPDQELRVWRAGAWQPSVSQLQNLDMLGIGATADATNRLTLQADGALFTHDGAGHRLSLNKASASDTASMLFQSAWTGHAEMGLAGDNSFALKLSPDGVAWQTALKADPDAEEISLSPAATPRIVLRDDEAQVDVPITGSAVQSDLRDATENRLMKVGAFGLGGDAQNISGSSIAAANLESGFYHFVGSSLTDGPFSNAYRGTLICVKGFDGRRRFIAWRDASSVSEIATWHGAQAIDENGPITWVAALNQSTLLGAVSQSGGVPTGATIEYGANANGNYVRFADGTQMCWVQDLNMGSIIGAGSGTFADPYRTDVAINATWPVAFSSSNPVVSCSVRLSGNSAVNASARSLLLQVSSPPGVSGWSAIRAQRVSSDATDRDALLSVFAIGRWF